MYTRGRPTYALFVITVVVFIFGLGVYACSGCEVRKRSEKRACKAGNADVCIALGKYYLDKAPGLIGFLMSYGDDADRYYFYGCKADNGEACELMYQTYTHGPDQAKNSSLDPTAVADRLIWGCSIGRKKLCDDLADYMDGSDWVANRSAAAFDKMCTAGNAQACYRLGALHGGNLGGLHNITEEVIPLYEKACKANVENSCALEKAYRARKAELDAQGSGAGSGTGSGDGSGAGSGSAAP